MDKMPEPIKEHWNSNTMLNRAILDFENAEPGTNFSMTVGGLSWKIHLRALKLLRVVAQPTEEELESLYDATSLEGPEVRVLQTLLDLAQEVNRES